MQAMILAAGFGTRLLPYTGLRPKPLFPLFNRALLLFTIAQLKASGFSRIIVNCHYLKEQIVSALAGIDGVFVQEEETVLGTGGGLRKALTLMNDEPLLIVNGDIYHTINLHRLYLQHEEVKTAKVTLAIHDYPRFNTIALDHGRICSFGGGQSCERVAFTGIHVVDPEILEPIAEGQQSCIIERYRQMVTEDCTRFNLVRVDGNYWCDMGTPTDYLALQGDLLCRRVPLTEEMARFVEQRIFTIESEYGSGLGKRGILSVQNREILPADLKVEDWASIGNAFIGKNVTLKRSIVWDGAHIEDDAIIEDCIITKEGSRE